MRILLVITATAGLMLTVIPSIFVFYGLIAFGTHVNAMIAGTLLWFLSALLWMKRGMGD